MVHQVMAPSEQMRCLHLAPLLFIILLSSVPPCKPQSDPYFRYSNCTPTPYQCGSVKFDVGYPFSVTGVNRPDYCSFPGYSLSCTNDKLVIDENSTGFQVTSVDYDNHLLTVIDQSLAEQTCLQPYRNTTINDTMFMYTDRDQFLTVYINCSATSSSIPFAYDIFSCLSGGRSYYTLDNGTLAPDVMGSCTSTLVTPYNSTMAGSLAAGNSSLGDAIKGGFAVKWKAGTGWCGDCRYSGGICGYNGSYPSDQTCFCPDGPSIGSCSSGLKKSSKKAIAIGTSVAAGVFFLLLVVVSFLYIRKTRQYKMTSSSRLLKYTASGDTPRSKWNCDMEMESGSVHSPQRHHFTYEELEEATEGFSSTREIGDGGFGTVYKGHLRDGRVVAVKRLYNNSCRHVEQFLNEAAIISRLRHPNLVMFYGCTSSRSRELVLVYEFVPNGTVADHLHGHRAPERALTWPLRLNIAVEAAAALAYLHAVEPPIVHRDVKTNNILLDADFHVKVADFGLSRLFPLDVTHVSTAPQGTPGYVDPEYHQCYQLTDKSDVYSFGVVLVELVSSKPAVDVTRDRNEINLAGMAVNKIQRGQLDELVDLKLRYGSDEATRKAMTMVAELAFRCLQQNGEMRPPIREVLDALRSIQEDGSKKKDPLLAPRSPDTVHAPWDSMSTTASISQ
ncbi:LEAF RUST 10 DISEASE-RESISTANCE LOCUS RECEPTOR-LIKE PROTEIN KINASE-like 1.2 isoform X2 [Phragmites australis]|uniref:LEAF RUST 10 DISEASE-RESISTANCE LOCUS RECEPTOR-LIKE PROTEIN KINASE-like 1.2 isoform X2 n=1 Tax=Phragmites australis TaxID=29695 RepID=UPI002D764D8C|nr:LEAF RUST 10 DISEASE-RESISTANCE LOCUS RECEPTOR-LIKE PROTEIN KINASE-like 1.2 isoform X2 [Phragmites australis]